MINLEELKAKAEAAKLFMPIARIYEPDQGIYIDWINPYTGTKEQVCALMWPVHAISDTEEVERTFEGIAELWEAANPQNILELIAMIERYRSALEWYADQDNWQDPDKIVPYWTLWDDGCNVSTERATEALKDTP